MHEVSFRMFFLLVRVYPKFVIKPLLDLWAPWSLDNHRSKYLFQLHRLGASPPQNFQKQHFLVWVYKWFKTVLSWERHGYAPTLCICYGESALAYKDCRCGHHLAYISCNHMSDLGRTWSRTHRLRAAIHLEAGCNGHQELTWDLCGVPVSGPSMGPVWRTMS